MASSFRSNTPTSITVGELNRQARSLLENSFMTVNVQGEISNFVAPASGHWYFSLKDSKAQVRCAMFRNRSALLKYRPKNGDKVIVRAKVSLYEGRGDFQLICDYIEEDGYGALAIALEQLKAKLQDEGLFSPDHKKPLPSHPTHIGLITAPTGAAIHDMLTVLKRRFPGLAISVYPTLVQGDEAAQSIARAIDLANRHNTCDVLIVGRGGGSREDLWAFNEEMTARAVFNSQIPIISAVGHEVDVVVTDLVADVRAPTPSAAAELVSPDQLTYKHKIAQYESRIALLYRQRIRNVQQQLNNLHARLRHPKDRLNQQAQKIDDLELRLQQSIKRHLERKQATLALSERRLSAQNTTDQVKRLKDRIEQSCSRMEQAMTKTIERKRLMAAGVAGKLNAVSPLATLDRGYAIVQNQAQQVITNAKDVSANEKINIRLHQGHIEACVVANDVNPEQSS